MHVLINAASANMGGSVTYLQNVLSWLPRLAPEDRFTVFVPALTLEKMGGLQAHNVAIRPYPFENTGGAARFYFDQVYLPRLIGKSGVDVLFSSTGFGTFVSPCPEVLLIRNLAYFDKVFHARYEELGRSLRRNTFRRWHSIASMRQSDVVMFPTQAMQEIVSEYVDLSAKRTASFHYGFDQETFHRSDGGVPGVVQDTRRWKAEGYHILLNVSTYAVQKNYETLIDALPLVKSQGLKVKLLLTISREKTTDKAEYDVLMRRAEELGVKDDLVLLGYVPYGQLEALYQAADLYVFPSFTESFGHSLVEAMAAGLPIVTADTPVNREVCVDAARYFSSFDAPACAAEISALLNEPETRSRLAESARTRAQHFSWERYTNELVGIFREAAGK